MTFRTKTVPILLVLLGGSVAVLLGLQLGWPAWVTVFPALALVALLSLLVVYQSAEPEREPDPYRPEPSPVAEPVPTPFTTRLTAPSEPPFNERRVDRVRLASARPDYTFVFSATVWWRPLRSGAGPAQPGLADLAVSTVLSRAQAVVGQEDPERWETAPHRLQSEIGCQRTDAADLITVLADGISLTLDEDDRIRLEKLSQLRKDEDDWERHRHFERSRRSYLGDEVLKTPGSAVVWWLARHDERVKDAVNMIGPLAQLSAAANDTVIPEPFRHVVAGYPDRESYLAAVNEAVDAEIADDTGYAARTPMPDAEQPPFSFGPDSAFPDDTDEGPRYGAYGPDEPDEPGPFGATATVPSGDAVDHIAGLLDELGLKEGTPERAAYIERIARTTEASGLSEEAERIRQRLIPDHCPPPGARPPFTAPAAPPPGHHGTAPDGQWTPADHAAPASAPADDAPRGSAPEEGWGPGHRPEEAPAAPTPSFDDRPGDGDARQKTPEGFFTGAPSEGEEAGGGFGAEDGYAANGQPAAPHSAPDAAPHSAPGGGHGPAPQPSPQPSPYDAPEDPSPFDGPEDPSPFDGPDRPGDPRPAGHDPRRGYGMPPEQAPDGGYAPPPNDAAPAGHAPGADTVPPANGTPPTGDPLWWGDPAGPSDDGPAAPPAGPPAAPRRVWAMPPADADGPDTPAAADRPEPPHDGGPQHPHTPGFG
ncbi:MULTISPECIES: hypothetical protein [Streptomyces]|uniref:Uncharacterized protein n=1 Tax=Streptomyces ramulosus TaxID=47762 RepID=A0ABW1FMK6_9ACTN